MKKRTSQHQLSNRASVTLALGLKIARNSQELSKLGLAELVGCSPQHVTDIEQQTRNPRQALIADMADALGQTPAELYQLGEFVFEQQTVEAVRERQRLMRSHENLEVILDVLEDLAPRDLVKLTETAQKLLIDCPISDKSAES